VDRVLLVDDTTGRKHLGGAPATLPTEENFDVGIGGVTSVTTANTFTALTKIEVLINGLLVREGSGNSWTRTVGNTISFTETIPENAWILVKLYL
jgi:hypothetical protein